MHDIRLYNNWSHRQCADQVCAREVGFGSNDQREITLIVDHNPEDNNYNFKINYVDYGNDHDEEYNNQTKSDTSRYSTAREAQEAADLWWSNEIQRMIETVVAW